MSDALKKDPSGSWRKSINKFLNSEHRQKFFETLPSLSTDQERIGLLVNNAYVVREVRGVIARERLLSSKSEKSAETCARMRQEGNGNFKRKNYDAAVENYTQCILHASVSGTDGENLLALGYSNRSAAFFFLKLYKECLVDIDLALVWGLPYKLRLKLQMRKVECFIALNKKTAAGHGLSEVTCTFANKSNFEIHEKDLMQQRLNQLKVKIAGLHLDDETCDESTATVVLPSVSHGMHPELDFASAGLDVRYDETRGRHIVANRPLAAGDVLIVERPFASVLLPQFYESHCHHCYSLLSAVIPCQSCARVRYCSDSCRSDSWRMYHRVECNHLDLLHAIGLGHLVLRVVLVAGIEFLLSNRSRIEELVGHKVQSPCQSAPSGGGSGYDAVLALVAHTEETKADDMITYTLTSCLLLMLLETATERPMTEDERLFVGAIMLRHTLQLICNAHAIVEYHTCSGIVDQSCSTEVEDVTQVCVAAAIFPSASLMNHSCQPSIILSFHKNILVVKAIVDVPVGGEICNCYGPHYGRMTREQRQQCLKQQYFFTCRCVRCEGDDNDSNAFRCPACNGPVVGEVCHDCSRVSLPSKASLEDYETSSALFKLARKLLDGGKTKDALAKLESCLTLRKKILYQYNRELGETHDMAARCCATLGLLKQSARHLRHAITVVERLFGADSIEVANELQKLTDILCRAIADLHVDELSQDEVLRGQVEEARDAAQRGFHIFDVHYGSSHPTTLDMIDKIEFIKIFEKVLAHV